MSAVIPTSLRPALKGDSKTASPLRILALTAGVSSSLRAEMTLDWLHEAIGGDTQIDYSEWNAGSLLDEEMLSVCDESAAQAHVIMVSDSDWRPMSAYLTQWLEHTLQRRRSNPPVLFALYCEAEGDSARGYLCSSLRRLASEWRTTFICNKDLDLGAESAILRKLAIA